MNKYKVIELIDIALSEIDTLVSGSTFYTNERESIVDTRKILFLLKKEIMKNPDKINIRVLRSTRNMGMYAYKDFENTPLEDTLGKITEQLYYAFPNYKDLKPLGMDFGKGEPI